MTIQFKDPEFSERVAQQVAARGRFFWNAHNHGQTWEEFCASYCATAARQYGQTIAARAMQILEGGAA